MEKLIPVINKLQDVFNTIGNDINIDLPQIVVVGSQSSGKSSVLESIVGRDFLPRGTGIVTRRPLVLQLINIPPQLKSGKSEADVEWGEFLHKPADKFYDFEKIREEIERETERLSGKNKNVSNAAINLKIFSPNVLNLTLVDLPGMTRVPVGDQPPDIELQIRSMIKQYIVKENSIILAITAANTDLSNSDALQLAREVDPDGDRTIGVLSKIDIMDKGTDALDMLLGRVIPLKLGFVGVINRSQQDINSKKSIKDALKYESEYFSTHSLYRNIANRLGTAYLAKTLNRILIQHIRKCLPDLKAKINKLLLQHQQEMLAYGDPLYSTKNGQGALLLQIITRFCASYRDAIDGKLTDLSVNELYGGARINYIFNELFSKCVDGVSPTDGLTTNDIRTAIRNATGPKAALFVPQEAFELLVKGQISRLEEPSIQCVERVHEELQRITNQLETKEFYRFIVLREKVLEVVNALLHRFKNPTKEMILNLVQMELAFINTNHPDFVAGDGAITAVLEKMSKNNSNTAVQQPNPQEKDPKSMMVAKSTGVTEAMKQTGKGQPPQLPPKGVEPMNTQPEYSQSFFSTFFGGGRGSVASPATSIQSKDSKQVDSYGSKSPIRSSGLETVPITLKPVDSPTEKENFETELIKHLLISYFSIVRKNVKDLIPKSIMHFLVNKSKESIQNELVSCLYKEELFEELLAESPDVKSKRENCQSAIDALKKASEILTDVRDFQIA